MGAKNTLVGQPVCDSAGRWDNGQSSGIANDWVTWYTEYTPKKAGNNLRIVIANTREDINLGEPRNSCDVDYEVRVTNTVTGAQSVATFNGATQITLAAGEFWQSDPVLSTFTTQKLRIFISTRGRAGGTYYVQDNSIPGRAWQAGQVWSASTGTWTANARSVSPYLITGEVGVGLTSVALVGDSILTGGPEYAALSARSDMCVVSLAMAGESAAVFAGLAGGTLPALVRAAVAKFCNHRVLGHSTNDLRGVRTTVSNSAAVSAIMTNVAAVVAMMQGVPALSRTYILTPPPYTGSTDSWATLANQNGTAESVGMDTIGKRNLLCDTMIAGVANTYGTLDRGSYYESQVSGNRGKFEPSTTSDGVHINQNSAPWIRWRDYFTAQAPTLFPDIYLQVGSITPTPASLSLAPGYAQELALLVRDLSNQPINLADVVAVSSSTSVATVDSPTQSNTSGLAYPVVKAMRTATAGQSATITVSVAGVQITVPVAIVASMGGGGQSYSVIAGGPIS